MNCPSCNTTLTMSERSGVEIDYCPQCRGVWLDRGELDKIIERAAALEGRRGDDRRDDYEYRFWSGKGNIVCSYSAGRSTFTAEIDDRIKEGAALFLRSWWRAYEQSVATMGEFEVATQSFPQCAIPQATKEMLRDVWLPQTGFGG